MLIRATGLVDTDFHLLTLGASTRYLLTPPNASAILFDPGAPAHLEGLLQRLLALEITPSQIGTIFLTHAHLDRIGAAFLLKKLNPSIQIISSAAIQNELLSARASIVEQERALVQVLPSSKSSPSIAEFLPLKLDRLMVEGELLSFGPGLAVRALAAPGHTNSSLALFIEPRRVLITDEVVGYFRGRELPAPGCDASTTSAIATLKSLVDLDIAFLCLPWGGALTGELIPRHLIAAAQTIEDVVAESTRARAESIPEAEILSQITQGLYAIESSDRLLRYCLDRSLKDMWRQIGGLSEVP